MNDPDICSFDGPFYEENITHLPPEKEKIGRYFTYTTISNTYNSVVMTATDLNTNSKKVIKFVKRRKETFDKIKKEIDLQKICYNSNILRAEDYFPYKEYICIVTPFTQHGSLHDYVSSCYPTGIPENIASLIMKQMLKAVSFLHKIGIAHRDIKPGNFLIFDANPEKPKVFLTDFGYAKIFEDDETSQEYLGTPILSAPQIIAKIPYDKSVDSWSLGITLFFMLCGQFPFPSYELSPKECKLRIVRGKLNYDLLTNKNISNEAIDLIKKLCRLSPKDRITPSQALNHPWLVSNQKQNEAEIEYGSEIYISDEFDDYPMI